MFSKRQPAEAWSAMLSIAVSADEGLVLTPHHTNMNENIFLPKKVNYPK